MTITWPFFFNNCIQKSSWALYLWVVSHHEPRHVHKGHTWFVGILWGVWPWADDNPQLPHRPAVKQTIKPGGDTTHRMLINHKVTPPPPHTHTQDIHDSSFDAGAAFELFSLATHTFTINNKSRAMKQLSFTPFFRFQNMYNFPLYFFLVDICKFQSNICSNGFLSS